MKKFILAASMLTALFQFRGEAQDKGQSPLLTNYYSIKDALVSGNADNAASAAASFVQAAKTSDASVKDKLITDASGISGTKDLARQREAFKALSDDLYQLAKSSKLSDQPIYQDYCPMKKASWLSNSTAIKNPYYGSQMLSCGKINDTIK
ncbi:DUF3347 domain-containing protein [Chitinophaga sp. 22536]|uniref:DUF3347 domain-containing protein n=1 Tax=unclassified Chitinophaga TaxID=2619133 RepID=UPI003F83B2DF